MGKITSLIEFNGKVGNLVGYKGTDGRNVLRYQPWKIRKSMTKAVQIQRILLANIINMWQAFRGQLQATFTTRKKGMSNFNAFVQAALNNAREAMAGGYGPIVYITKNQARLGACVVAGYMVSEGDLEPINVSMEAGGKMRTDLSLGTLEVTSETTVQEFTNAIIANNPDHNFEVGDMITVFLCTQRTSGADNLPRVHVDTNHIVLDGTDTRKLYEVVSSSVFGVIDGNLGTKSPVNGGITYIHTKEVMGVKKASTQFLEVNNDLLANYTNADAQSRALASYGGYVEDPLAFSSESSGYIPQP